VMRVFEHGPFPDSRLLGGSPMDEFPGIPPCRIPWSGKNAGNFADSAASCGNPCRKHL
jgi:hypothetical protein